MDIEIVMRCGKPYKPFLKEKGPNINANSGHYIVRHFWNESELVSPKRNVASNAYREDNTIIDDYRIFESD